MQNKLYQFDQALRNEIVSVFYTCLNSTDSFVLGYPPQLTASLAMFNQELGLIEEDFSYLSQVLSTPPKHPSISINSSHIDAIIALLDRWPVSQRFPGEVKA